MKNFYAAFRRTPFKYLFVATWLVAAAMLTAPLLAAPCAEVTAATLGADLWIHEIAAGDTVYLEVEAPAAGWLAVEASVPAGTETEARLALLGEACRPTAVDGVRIVARRISSLVVEVDAPGVHRFAVAAQDPAAPLAEVAFTTRFADRATLCDDAVIKTVAEPELDPDALALCVDRTVAEPELDPDLTVAEPELDPDLTVAEPELDPDLTVAEPELDPDALRAGLASVLCSHPSDDDHDDLLACATPLVPGKGVGVDLGWGGDTDVLGFELDGHRTVAIETAGDGIVHGALYDSSGHRLAADGGDDGLRLVRTLAPGRYSVRLTGDGHHTLIVTSRSW